MATKQPGEERMTAHGARLWAEQMRTEERANAEWHKRWSFLKAPDEEIDRRLSRTALMQERRRAPREMTIRIEDYISDSDEEDAPADAPAAAAVRQGDEDLLLTYRRAEYIQRDLPIAKYPFPQSTAQEVGWAWTRKQLMEEKAASRAPPDAAKPRNRARFNTLEVFGVGEYGVKRSKLNLRT